MNAYRPPTTPARILVVDDDRQIRELLKGSLERHGFDVEVAADTVEAQSKQESYQADAVILDLMMPGEDGLALCKRWASSDGPMILMFSALGSSVDRIAGLELGADAYLAKPCEPREIVAEIRSMLRRRRGSPSPRAREQVMFADWTLDFVSRCLLRPNGELLHLPSSEFRLLKALIDRPRRVLTRDQLLDAAYAPSTEIFDRAIDVQISRLRRKLHPDGNEIIRTIFNEGYLFSPAVSWP